MALSRVTRIGEGEIDISSWRDRDAALFAVASQPLRRFELWHKAASWQGFEQEEPDPARNASKQGKRRYVMKNPRIGCPRTHRCEIGDALSTNHLTAAPARSSGAIVRYH